MQGYSGKLEKLLPTAPLLRTLRLQKAGVESLDLGNASLDNLELEMSGIRRLILPQSTRSLKLYGELRSDLQIDDSLCGGKMTLEISLKNAGLLRYGLQNTKVQRLRLTDIKELDMSQAAAQFSEAEYLNLSGGPGTVTHMQEVGKLSGLRNFYCKDLFGYDERDMESLEGLQELRELDFDSVPKEAGLYLKKHWKGKLDRLSVTHLRDKGWLRDNLENPLRHWDGNEFIPEAAYRSAKKCYKDTKKLLTEAMGRAADRKEIEEIVRRYTQSFNKLNDRYEEFIETEEREDIFLAMQRLYEECILQGEYWQADVNAAPVTLSEIWNVMDEARENW